MLRKILAKLGYIHKTELLTVEDFYKNPHEVQVFSRGVYSKPPAISMNHKGEFMFEMPFWKLRGQVIPCPTIQLREYCIKDAKSALNYHADSFERLNNTVKQK